MSDSLASVRVLRVAAGVAACWLVACGGRATSESTTGGAGPDSGGTQAAGGSDVGGTEAGGTEAGGTEAGGTEAGGTYGGATEVGGAETAGTDGSGATGDVTGDTGGAATGGTGGGLTEGTGGEVAGGTGAGGAGGTGGRVAGDWGDLHEGPTDAVDMLFVIDNSISMADKQSLLSVAVPRIVDRLVSPGIDSEIATVSDLHIGVISSSLGGHGGVLCSPQMGDTFDVTQDDRGELIAPLRGLPSYGDLGFLKFDSAGTSGEITDRLDLVAQFTDLVTSAGELGCGYEATLEAWYRFLIDPQPPVEVLSDQSRSYPGVVNQTLLEQRSWFLRPNSLLVVVMLSDENDCSIRDDGVSWLITDTTTRIPRGTAACLADPNDPCCRSCALSEAAPPSGCGALADDAACQLGQYEFDEEPMNLRCFDQKRRFGLDFLYPVSRYIDGLRLPTVLGRSCEADADCPANFPSQSAGTCRDFGGSKACEYRNPLYAPNPNYPGALPRRPDMVYMAGIVGVPWQNVATPASLADPSLLQFVTGAELGDRWSLILGDPDEGILPDDPHMIESIDPRTGTHPLTGDALAPVTAPVGTDPINGHEHTIPQRDDLQYACIFELDVPRDCATAEIGCDCTEYDGASQDRPLCQQPGTTNFGTTQYYAKAYPGLRILQVLQAAGDNTLVASVCPKITDGARIDDPSYGYNPIMQAIVELTDANLVQ